MLAALKERPRVVIEAPRFSTVKRRSDGSIDFVSPLPCPFNYGSIPGILSDDGDPLDAVVMGRRLARGTVVTTMAVVGVIDFIDGGKADPKVIVSGGPLSRGERWALENFFKVYAVGKRALARLRGEPGETRFAGWLHAPARK